MAARSESFHTKNKANSIHTGDDFAAVMKQTVGPLTEDANILQD